MKTGESQRTDGTYQYRYRLHPKDKNYKYVYGSTLAELRTKEKEVQQSISYGLNYTAGKATVTEIVERFMQLKQNLRTNTTRAYTSNLNIIKKSSFGSRQVRDVKVSDAKEFLLCLSESYAYSTISAIKCLLCQSFQMAVEDDVVMRNPFAFKMCTILSKTEKVRDSLTDEQIANLLEYMDSNKCYRRHIDAVVLLLETGMRISEMYGLTFSDIDFEHKKLTVNKQLLRDSHGVRYIQKPKTKSGYRSIPLSEKAERVLRHALRVRKAPKEEVVVDGITGFIFLDRNGKPRVADNLERSLQKIVKNYNEEHEADYQITPHVFRHTFSTEMARRKIPLKTHQYLMGHSDVTLTMNRYTHVDYETVAGDFFASESAG